MDDEALSDALAGATSVRCGIAGHSQTITRPRTVRRLAHLVTRWLDGPELHQYPASVTQLEAAFLAHGREVLTVAIAGPLVRIRLGDEQTIRHVPVSDMLAFAEATGAIVDFVDASAPLPEQ